MRGVAIADVHLGFAGPGRLIGGRNARELDVEAAWAAAVENTVRLQPDLVTIAGDVFHHPRVSVHALTAFRNGIRRLVRETAAHVVIIQGNHDAAKSAASKSPIHIPEDYERVYVVLEPTRIPLTINRTGERVAVACFPFVSLGSDVAYKVEPDSAANVNVLLVHAAVKGGESGDALPSFYAGEGALDIAREAERWDVVAVGDYHEFTHLHPTRVAFYSGSVERTSSNIWPERAPKGVVSYDTATGTMELVEHPTRPMFDDRIFLGDASCSGTPVEVLNDYLTVMTSDSALQDAIVRLVVMDFPRADRDRIDWSVVRALKASCLHFQLDLRWAKRVEDAPRDRRVSGARSFDEEARAFFSDEYLAVRNLALQYLGLEPDAGPVALAHEESDELPLVEVGV